MTEETLTKESLEAYVSDLLGEFFYYHRKEDDEFTVEMASNLSLYVTEQELIDMFVNEIKSNYK